jgi:CHAT domain-containing protein/tetratricopeptide (TPR) repeat protein
MRARIDHPRVFSSRGTGLAAALCWFLLLAPGHPGAGASAATDTVAAPAEARAGVPDFEARKQNIKDVIRKADYKQAESLAGALLAEAETAFGKDSVEVASVLDLLVQTRFEGGRATEAESLDLAQRAVRLRESAPGQDDLGLAASLANLATISYYRGDVAQAIALTQRTLELRERALGPEAPQVVASMANLGGFFWVTGDFARARSTLERAVEIQERNPQGDRSHLAAMQGNLAGLCAEMGDFTRARELHERSLALTEETLGPDHPAVAVALTTLASTLQDTGDDEAARPLLERALRIQEKALGPTHFDIAPTLDGLGRLSARAGDYAQARASFERALAILRPADGGPIHPNASVVLDSLGGVSLQLGDYPRAQDEYTQSLQIEEKLSGPDHPRISTPLRHLAWVKIQMGDLEGARPLVERAARIAEAGSGNLPQYAVALANLGDLRRRLGDDAAALDLLSRSLDVQRRATGEESASMALRYGSLGDLYRDRGDDAKAREQYERCVALLEKTLPPDHPKLAEALGSLALTMAKTGEPGPALATALRAEAIGREHVRLTARALSEREALGYAASQASSLDLVLSLLAHAPDVPDATVDQAWEELALARGLVLDEMGARNRAAHALSDPAAERLRGEYVAARRHLANLLVREVGGSGGSAALRFAHDEVDRTEQALLAASTEFRAQQARESAGLADLLAGLPDGTALVSYAAYHDLLDGAAQKRPAAGRGRASAPTRDLAFVREAHGPSFHLVTLGDGDAIDALTADVRRELPAPGLRVDEQAYRAAGERLRRRVWDPVAPHLTGSERAFIVADGSLQLIDFGALPAEGASAYLIERPPLLHLLSSERDLLAGVSAPARGGLLAMGDPDFGAAAAGASRNATTAGASRVATPGGPFRGSRSDCPGFERVRWQRLPQTAREVDEVVQIWSARGPGRSGASPTISKLTGQRASEAAFKQLAPGRRLLHLATHGFFLAEDCAPPAPSAAPDGSGPRENPLHLSGLVLAGANRRAAAGPDEEDDVVTAEEIAALDLGATEWAVLSGCDTGVGAIQSGEGVFGLRRAFRVAGARTVVMSLRPVQDLLARAWMKSLYEARFAKGLDTAAAARAASLAELRQRRAAGQSTHPAFWAAFIAAGDWR